MVYTHNQICTTGNDVTVGQKYIYKEDSYIADVIVLKDNSDEKGIGFKLKVLKENYQLCNKTFDCWAATGNYGYSGMWRLFDYGSYMF